MPESDARLDMRLAPKGGRETFVYLMSTYRYSCRTLADAVTAELDRRHRTFGAPRLSCSKSHIGNLRSGAARVCSREIASAIEQVLQVQPGVLFVPKQAIHRPAPIRARPAAA